MGGGAQNTMASMFRRLFKISTNYNINSDYPSINVHNPLSLIFYKTECVKYATDIDFLKKNSKFLATKT